MFRISTWNVNSINVRLPHILQWLESDPVDVLAIQETKVTDDKFPLAEIEAAGYQVVFAGQKTYNGVAILSKQAAADVVTDIDGLDDPQRRIMCATIGDVRVLNVYVPNGQSVDSEKYTYKLNWLEKVHNFVEAELSRHEHFIMLGDFNIAPADEDVHDPEAWRDQVLCSEPERDAFQEFIASGLSDSFRLFEQSERVFSWWDYRQLGFQKNRGLRIDHILASEALTEHALACYIDKTPRKWERPSDHAPVVAEFDI